jgi:peptidoglycan/LPS O-acetylase OafA/YrhL
MKDSNFKKKRIETLDWLRGLMALSIMLYHLSSWVIAPLNIDTILGRLGIYGVSIFFILSGLSMAIVYNSYIKDFTTSIIFFIRRIFRIWPLLWIVCILIFMQQYTTGTHSWKLLFVNVTTLFGFIKPTAYIATGAWSIGNEMVYYAFTPIIVYLYNKKNILGNLFLIICTAIGMLFAFYFLDSKIVLSNQWSLYVNPFNNLFLYVIGISIYYNFKDVSIKQNINILILLITTALFCFLPFHGDQILIVSGFGRIIFVVLSTTIVFCFYKLRIKLPLFISSILESLGLATYGIYLIHPVVYMFILKIENDFIYFSLISIVTIISSIISYKFFEIKFINLGKKVTLQIFKP